MEKPADGLTIEQKRNLRSQIKLNLENAIGDRVRSGRTGHMSYSGRRGPMSHASVLYSNGSLKGFVDLTDLLGDYKMHTDDFNSAARGFIGSTISGKRITKAEFEYEPEMDQRNPERLMINYETAPESKL